MGDREERGSTSSTTAIVVVVVVLLLGLPCLAAVLLFGTGIFFYRALESREPVQPPIVERLEPAPPVEAVPQPAPVDPAPQGVEENTAEPPSPVDDSK